MGTLRVTTISDTAGTGPVTLTKQSAAKLYINFDMQASNVINSSLNVSSCTDHATGTFTCSYSNNMSDALYHCATGIRDGSGENDIRVITGSTDAAYYTSGSSRWVCGTHSATATVLTVNDPHMAFLQIHGDLA